MKGQTLWTIFVLALVIGCHTAPPGPPPRLKADEREIKIETDPPGMRIFYGMARTAEQAERGREYVGQSPCALIVKCDEEGRFLNTVSGFSHPQAVFFAEPPHDATNLFSQRQEFAVPAAFRRPGKIPSAVFFDMHRQP